MIVLSRSKKAAGRAGRWLSTSSRLGSGCAKPATAARCHRPQDRIRHRFSTAPADDHGARRSRMHSWAPGQAASGGSVPHRPLLVTSDEPLLDELLRLCAAAGVEAQVAHDATSAQLPRRRGVVVVPVGLDDAAVWDAAAVMGSEGVLPLPNGQALLVDRLGEA